MKVHINIFPIAGLCNQSKKLDLNLEEGNLGEVLILLEQILDAKLSKLEELIFLHNGRGVDKRKEILFQDGDQLWLLPMISGG